MRSEYDSHLRFVFHDTVVSVNLPGDATYGEVARTLDELSGQHHSKLVAIDVTMHPNKRRRSHGTDPPSDCATWSIGV